MVTMQSDKVHKIKVHFVGWDGVGRMSEKLRLKDELLPEEIDRGAGMVRRQHMQRP